MRVRVRVTVTVRVIVGVAPASELELGERIVKVGKKVLEISARIDNSLCVSAERNQCQAALTDQVNNTPAYRYLNPTRLNPTDGQSKHRYVRAWNVPEAGARRYIRYG